MRASRGPLGSSRRLEIGALALAVACAGGLFFAAFVLAGTPRLAGELALSRAAGELAAAVEREWLRLLARPEDWIVAEDWTVRWRPGAAAPPAAAAPREAADDPNALVFDALFAEARRQELSLADPVAALQTVRDALALEPEPVRRARARLRAIQLARRVDSAEIAGEQWRLLLAEARGDEAEGGISALLLGGLAFGSRADAEERRAARDALAERWIAGRLALPSPAFAIERGGDGRLAPRSDGAWAAYLEAIQALVPEVPDARLERDREARRAAAVARRLGALPAGAPVGRAELRVVGEDAFVYRAAGEGVLEGGFLTRTALAARLAAELEALALVPPGFAVELDGAAPGERVRPPALLAGGLPYTIRHADPEELVRSEARRLGVVRAGLIALGAFVLLAGLASARALRRAQRLQELRARFVASVSHELRTPVTAILLTSERLAAGKARTPERLAQYHGLIEGEARRLRRLVDDALDFARLERGEGPRLARERVALADFAAALEREAQAQVEAAGLRFECAAAVDGRPVLIDAEALRRAVGNLVENAIRHAESPTVHLAIEAGAELVLRVEDEGRGIPAERRASVFEPFEQLDGDESGARGTGLGLAIVREIARGHGGRVTCRPRSGGPGSAFELRVPLETAPDAPADAGARTAPDDEREGDDRP